jgi:hypothetical protein
MAGTRLKLTELKQLPDNPRQRTARGAGMLQESLQRFGALRGVVADEDGKILAGNGTVEAAIAAGMLDAELIPVDGSKLTVLQVSHLSEAEKRQYAVADNRTTDLSTWNPDVLAAWVEAEAVDLDGFFFPDELDAVLEAGAAADAGTAEPADDTAGDDLQGPSLIVRGDDLTDLADELRLRGFDVTSRS